MIRPKTSGQALTHRPRSSRHTPTMNLFRVLKPQRGLSREAELGVMSGRTVRWTVVSETRHPVLKETSKMKLTRAGRHPGTTRPGYVALYGTGRQPEDELA